MLDACNLLKLEGCVSTRKQLHMYYITARMMPLPITCMMENLNKKILSWIFSNGSAYVLAKKEEEEMSRINNCIDWGHLTCLIAILYMNLSPWFE
jgi:hypothetical protein